MLHRRRPFCLTTAQFAATAPSPQARATTGQFDPVDFLADSALDGVFTRIPLKEKTFGSCKETP